MRVRVNYLQETPCTVAGPPAKIDPLRTAGGWPEPKVDDGDTPTHLGTHSLSLIHTYLGKYNTGARVRRPSVS